MQVCYLSLNNILFELAPDERGRAKKSFMCIIWDVQLDSHLDGSPFKIALYPADDNKKRSKRPFLGIDTRLCEHPRNWIFDLFTLNLHPMHLRVDYRLVTFLKSLAATYTEADPVELDERRDPFSSERCLGEGQTAGQEGLRALTLVRRSKNWNFDPTSAAAVEEALGEAHKAITFLHFKVFNIAAFNVNISFASSFSNSTTDDSNNIAKTLSHLRDVSLKISRVMLVNEDFQGSSDLQAILAEAYGRDIKRQGAKLLGSLDALGNIAGLWENVTGGGADFIEGFGHLQVGVFRLQRDFYCEIIYYVVLLFTTLPTLRAHEWWLSHGRRAQKSW